MSELYPTTHIYALVDPFTCEPRYVGKADDPEARLYLHLLSARDPKYAFNPHRTNWLKKVLGLGGSPILQVLEVVPQSEWRERERWWIADFRAFGFNLTNQTGGGDGGNPTPEYRERMRLLSTGRVPSEETRRKISEALKGRIFTAEWRAKMSAAQKGRPGRQKSPEERAKLAAKLKGRKPAPQTLEAAAAAIRKARGITDPVMVMVHCAYCGTEFQRESSLIRRVKRDNHYCCTEHWYAHAREEGLFKAKPSTEAVLRPCVICGVMVRRFPCQIAASKTGLVFCPEHRGHRNKAPKLAAPDVIV